ncbi:helix-turn-helix domain-containing protein [Pannus brasiliensis CCIBt3594]|uniref:Helix-turn-helix domain-containing protein n=1 Tax=Pannus brasiliensis CCIBt3594 TaxID=1427578 RepID=A0AAW9QS51_9CHRO
MLSPVTEPFTPSVEDKTLARDNSRILASLLSEGRSHYRIHLVSGESDTDPLILPAAALNLLAEALEQMAEGNAVALVPLRRELSTSEAAELLGVSRPYLVGLLESGQIPFRKVGARRRVLHEDAIAYKRQIDARRERTLAELAAQAQELNMGYE